MIPKLINAAAFVCEAASIYSEAASSHIFRKRFITG